MKELILYGVELYGVRFYKATCEVLDGAETAPCFGLLWLKAERNFSKEN